MRFLLSFTLFTLLALSVVLGRPSGTWNDNPPELRQWYADLMRPDNPKLSCCGEADAYYTDEFDTELVNGGTELYAIITDDRDIPGRSKLPLGMRVHVPMDKVKSDQGNPTGHGIIFITGSGYVLCYLLPSVF